MLKYIKIQVRIVVEPDEDRFYAFCPELKGVHVEGGTEEEAFANAKDAATAYMESIIKNNDPLPLCAKEFSTGDAVSSILSNIGLKKVTSRVEDLNLPLPV